MLERWEHLRCEVCRQKSLRRVPRAYEYDVSHDGRPPVKIRIPDLVVIACTNPDCNASVSGEAVILDDDAIHRVTVETYRQLGLLTPKDIKAGRERLGLSQQELASLLGLGGNSLSRWENGRVYQSRSTDTLLRLVFAVPAVIEFLKQRRREGSTECEHTERTFPYLDLTFNDSTCGTVTHQQLCPRDAGMREAAGFSPRDFLVCA